MLINNNMGLITSEICKTQYNHNYSFDLTMDWVVSLISDEMINEE